MTGVFSIAPLLDRSLRTARFDPYEHVLVAKIRAGQYSADLWDCNGLLLDYPQRIGTPCYRQVSAFVSRYVRTPEERKAYDEERRAAWRADAAARAERAAARAAERAAAQEREAKRNEERERVKREWVELRAKREAEAAERAAEWEREGKLRAAAQARADADVRMRTAQWHEDKERILNGHWECNRCKVRSTIQPVATGYVLRCPRCDRTSWTPHETMVAIVTRNIQLEPLTAG
jgi:flagellar biosynthesis GTPase FlhF